MKERKDKFTRFTIQEVGTIFIIQAASVSSFIIATESFANVKRNGAEFEVY